MLLGVWSLAACSERKGSPAEDWLSYLFDVLDLRHGSPFDSLLFGKHPYHNIRHVYKLVEAFQKGGKCVVLGS